LKSLLCQMYRLYQANITVISDVNLEAIAERLKN